MLEVFHIILRYLFQLFGRRSLALTDVGSPAETLRAATAGVHALDGHALLSLGHSSGLVGPVDVASLYKWSVACSWLLACWLAYSNLS